MKKTVNLWFATALVVGMMVASRAQACIGNRLLIDAVKSGCGKDARGLTLVAHIAILHRTEGGKDATPPMDVCLNTPRQMAAIALRVVTENIGLRYYSDTDLPSVDEYKKNFDILSNACKQMGITSYTEGYGDEKKEISVDCSREPKNSEQWKKYYSGVISALKKSINNNPETFSASFGKASKAGLKDKNVVGLVADSLPRTRSVDPAGALDEKQLEENLELLEGCKSGGINNDKKPQVVQALTAALDSYYHKTGDAGSDDHRSHVEQ